MGVGDDTALYRMYDSDDELLYVGISCNPGSRIAQHAEFKEWYEDVAIIRIAWLSTRRAALKEEAKAIVNEDPKYNIIHSTSDENFGPKRDVFTKFRSTTDERDRINKAAKLAGIDASKLMRDTVMRRVQRIEREGARKPVGESK